MKRRKIVKTCVDSAIEEISLNTPHKPLATWAADCAERVLPYFEEKYPGDTRPRDAISALRAWIRTGEFHMSEVRRATLAAHTAARTVEEADAARSAARAAGQAMATAHVPRHALAAALYAATAVRDASSSSDAESATIREREWQLHHLKKLVAWEES